MNTVLLNKNKNNSKIKFKIARMPYGLFIYDIYFRLTYLINYKAYMRRPFVAFSKK